MDRSARESARHAHGPKSGFEAQRYYRREKTKSSGQYVQQQQRRAEVNKGGERGGDGGSGSGGGGDDGTGSAVVEDDEEMVMLRPTPKSRSRSTPLVATVASATSTSIKHGRAHELRSPLLPQHSPDSKSQLQSTSAATNAHANVVRTPIQQQPQPPLSPAQDEDEAAGAAGPAIRGRFPNTSPNPEVCTQASSICSSDVIFSELRSAALTEPHL